MTDVQRRWESCRVRTAHGDVRVGVLNAGQARQLFAQEFSLGVHIRHADLEQIVKTSGAASMRNSAVTTRCMLKWTSPD